jgi:membrane protease YdiL (CAAX protease family)
MSIRKLLVSFAIIGILIFLVWIPFQHLFPGVKEEVQLLIKRLINGSLIILFGWVLIRRFKLQKTDYLHVWSFRNKRALWPLLGAILLLLLLQYTRISGVQEKAGMLLFVLFVVLIKTTAEEIIFRGVLQTWYIKEGLNHRQSVFFASLFFSLVHVVNFFTHGDWVSLICQVIFAFFMGLLLGAVNLITRNILVCCILHAIVNIPAALQQLERQKELVSEQTDMPVPLGEGLVSVLFFCLIYSPLIILALYYYRHPKVMENPVSGT